MLRYIASAEEVKGSVAAVVVTFNRKELLCECLDALLAQTCPLSRILLVDNASTDGTADFWRRRVTLRMGQSIMSDCR